MSKIERVEYKEEVKESKSEFNINTLLGLLIFVTFVMGFIAIWVDGIWFQIFLTLTLASVFLGALIQR
ncbi:MAG: hypothetical protein EOL97_10030 [Spirochaetia bacterium]|nr:hypothetical protein [Spirochaetia bacterium]